MNRYTTQGIVLSRTDYGEADRIITFLTANHGKVRAIAKGVRRTKSKLAGGIELFSVSDLTLLIGRGEIETLMSTRLAKHYANIVKELPRTQAGYDIIKITNKATEDAPEEAYFSLLKTAFEVLDDLALDPQITHLWFSMQLLKLAGHTPNLQTDNNGTKLTPSTSYTFHLEEMCFAPKDGKQGSYSSNHIKFLRLGFGPNSPQALARVENASKITTTLQPLLQSMLKTFFRL